MTDDVDAVRRLVEAQHGAMTPSQAVALGFHLRTLRRNGQSDPRVHPFPSAFVLPGHAADPDSRRVAAALHYGGLLCHASAAWWHRLDGAPVETAVHVTIPHGRRRSQISGTTLHRTRYPERASDDGPPVTSVARTLLDLAPTVGRRRLETMLGDALRRELVDGAAIAVAAAAAGPRSGAAPLVRLLEDLTGRCESDAEQRFALALKRAELSGWETQYVVHDHAGRVRALDFAWPEIRLNVEVDGFTYHGEGARFRQDRRQDARLVGLDWAVVRVAADDVYAALQSVLDHVAAEVNRRYLRAAG